MIFILKYLKMSISRFFVKLTKDKQQETIVNELTVDTNINIDSS